VARWETGAASPSLSAVDEMLALGGLRLGMVDTQGRTVAPMREDAARDRAGRRFPAHVDLHALGWWVPPGLHLSVEWVLARRRAARERIPDIGYVRSAWRDTMRRLQGVPDDHPTWDELVSAVETRVGPH
jgi:HTH-type transcriptional regulator/antitoxin HipB